MMINNINVEHTLYAVYLYIDNTVEVETGKLGNFQYNKGTYIYVGSAKRNIKARLNRHIKIHKNKHWHFDYIRPYGEIIKIVTYKDENGECNLCSMLLADYNGSQPVKRFGSSDCKCKSHLIYIGSEKKT